LKNILSYVTNKNSYYEQFCIYLLKAFSETTHKTEQKTNQVHYKIKKYRCCLCFTLFPLVLSEI